MERWQEGAACSAPNIDTNMFFVERGEDTRPAKAICAACDVQVECLQYALDANERMGVYGGCSERERRRIKHMGISALEFLEGVEAGTYIKPVRGRPKVRV